jgi:AcrR family transcriptional regulator
MATTISQSARVSARRDATIEHALDHAQAIVAERGAGAVTVSEIARRLGMRAPSLYKYFPSLHSIYDALFARGNARVTAYIQGATQDTRPGLQRTLASSRAMVRWSMRESGLAPLLYWRPIPGFVPSQESFEPSQQMWQQWRQDLAIAVQDGDLASSADSDEALRMLTVLISGICSQQMANQPGASYDDGVFSSLTDPALEMFVAHHQPRKGSRGREVP